MNIPALFPLIPLCVLSQQLVTCGALSPALWEESTKAGKSCGIRLHETECQGSGSGNLLPYTGPSLTPHVACQTVTGLMVSFPATWQPCVFSQAFAYARAQLLCVQCLHRTPCYLLIEVFTSAASITWGPECLGDVNEHTLALPGRERQLLWHRWGGSPQVRPESFSRVGMRAQPHCSSSLLVAAGKKSKDVVASPNQPALYQDLGKESTLLHLWPWGDSAPWSGGTCLATAMQCHIPGLNSPVHLWGGSGSCKGSLCLGKRHW